MLIVMMRESQQNLSAEDQVRSFIDSRSTSSADPIMLADDFGIIKYVNEPCAKMFGYQSREMRGKNVKIIMTEPYRTNHPNYLKKFRETRQKKIVGQWQNVNGMKKSGTVFQMTMRIFTLPDGSLVGVFQEGWIQPNASTIMPLPRQAPQKERKTSESTGKSLSIPLVTTSKSDLEIQIPENQPQVALKSLGDGQIPTSPSSDMSVDLDDDASFEGNNSDGGATSAASPQVTRRTGSVAGGKSVTSRTGSTASILSRKRLSFITQAQSLRLSSNADVLQSSATVRLFTLMLWASFFVFAGIYLAEISIYLSKGNEILEINRAKQENREIPILQAGLVHAAFHVAYLREYLSIVELSTLRLGTLGRAGLLALEQLFISLLQVTRLLRGVDEYSDTIYSSDSIEITELLVPRYDSTEVASQTSVRNTSLFDGTSLFKFRFDSLVRTRAARFEVTEGSNNVDFYFILNNFHIMASAHLELNGDLNTATVKSVDEMTIAFILLAVTSVIVIAILLVFWISQYRKVLQEVTAYRFLDLVSVEFTSSHVKTLREGMKELENSFGKRLNTVLTRSHRERLDRLASMRQSGSSGLISDWFGRQGKYRILALLMNFGLIILFAVLFANNLTEIVLSSGQIGENDDLRFEIRSSAISALQTLDPTLNSSRIEHMRQKALFELEELRDCISDLVEQGLEYSDLYEIQFQSCPPAGEIEGIYASYPSIVFGNPADYLAPLNQTAPQLGLQGQVDNYISRVREIVMSATAERNQFLNLTQNDTEYLVAASAGSVMYGCGLLHEARMIEHYEDTKYEFVSTNQLIFWFLSPVAMIIYYVFVHRKFIEDAAQSSGTCRKIFKQIPINYALAVPEIRSYLGKIGAISKRLAASAAAEVRDDDDHRHPDDDRDDSDDDDDADDSNKKIK